jgi:hypothetical protein
MILSLLGLKKELPRHNTRRQIKSNQHIISHSNTWETLHFVGIIRVSEDKSSQQHIGECL